MTRVVEILEHLNNTKYNAKIEMRTAVYIAKELNSTPDFIHRTMNELVAIGYVNYIIAYPNGNHMPKQNRVRIYYLDTGKGELFLAWAREQRIV